MLPQAEDQWTRNEAAHLLNRAGFGGSPRDIAELHALGRHRAVETLLAPEESHEAFPPPPWATPEAVQTATRERAEKRRALFAQIRGMPPEEADQARRQVFQQIQRENRQQTLEGQAWWFRRMLRTKAPLREKMTLFWHDHFATSIQKVREPYLMMRQNELFRSHATGSFRELTHAILMDPAMMFYLDSRDSRKGKPNENFPRELMELFTLGEGNYTEDDIREAARAITGYQVDRFTGTATHNLRQWDGGEKTIFGKTGRFNGTDVINLIFDRSESATFIARKIWEFFVYEHPSDAAVSVLAETLRKADYRIGPLLRSIFLSGEFYSEASIRSQIKCPVQYLIAMLKQLDITEPPGGFALTAQQQLGQVLFMPPNVAGWDWGQAWINTSTLLSRYNLAGFLTQGAGETMAGMGAGADRMPGMARAARRAASRWSGPDYETIAPRPLREEPEKLVDELISRFFQGPVPARARESFVAYAIAKKGAVFTNRETAELCHLMLSTPYYQLC
jgi:uncharacterized protein (DUF1800 family)